MSSAGTIFYMQIEGWSILDAFYFSAITLTTVGYADLVPSTPAGKLFTVFFIFAGLGIILGFVNAVARVSAEQRSESRGLLKRSPQCAQHQDENSKTNEQED